MKKLAQKKAALMDSLCEIERNSNLYYFTQKRLPIWTASFQL